MTTKSQIKLLIVDDEREILYSLKQLLEFKHYAVTTCNNVEQAINAIKYEHYDLVLTDIEMPVKTGLDLIATLREGMDVSIPIVIMTGRATMDYLAEALRLGASDFINKPVNGAMLDELIKNHIRKSKRKKLDYNLSHSLQESYKLYKFLPEEFFNNSIVEFLNSEIQKNFKISALKKSEIGLILEEVISNAFLHGIWELSIEDRRLEREALISLTNKKNYEMMIEKPKQFVSVEMIYKNNYLHLFVKDTGKGFNFSKYLHKGKITTIDPRSFNGRGLFLIMTLSEDLKFHDNGSKIEIIISINKNA